MGAIKSHHFTKKQNQVSTVLKALGHPARIAIVEYLIKKKSCICNDIVNELPLAQPTISQHLKELKTAGLIQGSIEGNAICYCLDEKGFAELNDYLVKIFKNLNVTKCNC